MKFKTKLFITLFSVALVLSACSFGKPAENNNKPVDNTNQENKSLEQQLSDQSNIKKFADYDDFLDFIENNPTINYYDGGMVADVSRGMAMEETMPMATQKVMNDSTNMGGSEGSSDYSKTNIQVEGVDEADIIKTDGKYVYAVVKNDLFIINAYPAGESKILAKIAFKSRPQDLYISDNRLAIYGHDNTFYEAEPYQRFRRQNSFSFFKVFDISDRTNPKQIRDIDIEGNYTDSRMIGEYIYFVTTTYNYYYIQDEPVLPRIIDNGDVLANKCSPDNRCIMPDIYYFDIPYNNYNLTTITAINIKDENKDLTSEVYMLSGSQNMYVSQNNIYITYTKYISEYQLEMEVIKEILFSKLSLRDQDRINKIEATDNFILSPDEKRNKIQQILERYASSLTDAEQEILENDVEQKMKQKYVDISKELEKTVIHKIAIKNDNIEYQTSGEVTGNVLNQFSMDENDGYFRIATTKNRTWSRYEEENRESYNNLYVLDNNLKQVGEIENLAEGERIYSVRFMQDRAYMVTFKQTDPLFVIDLKNPHSPKVLGELKIPGFSNYLHPYNDDLLIGIGKDTTENEWGGIITTGIKLSLFDVSDVANPEEVDTYIMGDKGSDSIALNDHKAFLFDKEKELLAIPVSIREGDGNSYGRLTFSGAAVFKITKQGFELKGKIDHSDGGRSSETDYWGGYQYYDNTVKRSLYIDDTLYTFSNNYLMMNKLDTLNLVKKLELKKAKVDSGDDFEIIN